MDETFQIKEDIARQFTFNGKIDSQNVADIVQNPSDSNRYTATINGYTGFEIKYVGETIEMSPCIVKKGLLKRDQTATLSSKIDRVKQTPETKEISLQLNAEQSKLYINQKLAESTTGDQGVYEVKSAADITDKNIKLIYKNDILQTIDEQPVEDEITLSLDKDFMISKKQEQNVPITRQKSQGTTEVVTKNDVYKLDNDATKMTYYAKTENGTNNPSIKIINTIIKRTETNTTTTISPLFPQYTNKINQKNTVEKYSKKINFQYDTPETTSIEKTFQENAHTEYINGGYLLRATFTIKNKTQPLVLSVPAIYTQGTKENQNTSTLNFKQPTLSFSDEYNKIMGDKIMIDGVVYVLYTANSKQKNIPNIIFRHDTEATLEQAKQRAEKYQIQSNVFTNDRKIDEETLNYMQVNAGLGNLQFGPLMVKDGKREDPITYAKDIFVGQVKEDKRIILQGTKL